jgi:hypothetical protein
MSLSLFFERSHRVLLVRMGAELSEQTLAALDAAVRAFAAAHGACRGLLDLSPVERVTIPSAVIAAHGRRPARLAGQRRVLVAPTDALFGICRMFGANQDTTTRGDAPDVVRTLAEAYALLGLVDPDFQPLDPDPPRISA